MVLRPGEVTQLLRSMQEGDASAQAKLMTVMYSELRRLAASCMRRERPNHTLQPTALVHEVYVRLVGQDKQQWQDRAHFIGVASHLMRQILIDHARARVRLKRGGGATVEPLDERMGDAEMTPEELLAIDECLIRLAKLDARQSRIVELRFFGGLSVDEAAHILGISAKTVKRDWSVAKAWLFTELQSHRSRDRHAAD